MKRFMTVLFAATLTATSSFAANLLAYNTEEYRLQGNIDFDSAAGSEFDIEFGYGYFVADYFEVGGFAGYLDNDLVSSGRLGFFGEYNFETETDFIPFVGTQVSYVYSSYDILDVDDSASAAAFGAYLGLKYFIYENMAVSARLLAEAATEDVYAEEDGASDTDFGIDFGLRFFF